MATSEIETQEKPVCPSCGHENIPGASFCAKCGTNLKNGAPSEAIVVPPVDDAQSTSVFEPVAERRTESQRSQWAPPVIDVSPSTDAGQTSALPVDRSWQWSEAATAPARRSVPRHRESPRGLILGIIAVILIALVLAVYVYAAWLGDSARDTIDGWLPWVS